MPRDWNWELVTELRVRRRWLLYVLAYCRVPVTWTRLWRLAVHVEVIV